MAGNFTLGRNAYPKAQAVHAVLSLFAVQVMHERWQVLVLSALHAKGQLS